MTKLTRVRTPSEIGRSRLLSRTALCGALYGLQALLPSVAQAQSSPTPTPPPATTTALPAGGLFEFSAGGGAPVITTSTGQLNVALHAPRTVLSWTTFNVGPESTVNFKFDAKSWIVLNRIIGLSQSKIEGIVTGKVGGEFGGNIWFVSNAGIVFGRNAQIDAGGILVAIGTPDTAKFLIPSNNLFSFAGGDALPDAKIFVLGGGKINGHGGLVALAGPTVTTRANAMVTADGGSVLYGSAKTYQIRLAPGTGGNFDLVDFIVPDASGGSENAVALDLAGDTRAGAVFVAAVSKSAIGSAVINLEGMVTATGAGVEGGDIVLSGGGGILDRAPAASLDGAAATDIYLNRATASRDMLVRNVGHIYARPWVRPPEEVKDPPTIEEEAAAADDCTTRGDCGNGNGNGNGNGYGNGYGGGGNGYCGNGGCAPIGVDLTGPLASLFNPQAVSSISLGRDTRIQATASIELGRIVSGRDISVSGPEIKGNSLIAGGGLTVTATEGDISLAGVGVNRDGVITSARGDVKIDAISAPQKLNITSGRDIMLGDGTSSVAGLITLKAAQNVTLELASAKIDTVTAGSTANLRGGALDIGTVTAPRLFAQAGSVKIGTATSTGDVYVIGTNGDAIVGTANAGDDVFILATHGTASLGSAVLGAGPDGVSFDFSGSPDQSGNGKVVRVESVDLDAKLGLGTGSVTGATTTTVRAGRDAIVDLTRDAPGIFSVIASRDATLRAPTAKLDNLSAGRDLTFATTSGDLTLTSALTAARNISISAGGALSVTDVRADAGSVLLSGSTVKAGNVSASDDLTLKATSGGVTTTSYKAGRDLIVQGSTLSLGSAIGPVTRDLSITSLGNFTTTNDLTAGRNLTLAVAGAGTFRNLTANSGTVQIVANSLTTGVISTPGSLTVDVTGKAVVGQASGANVRLQAGDLTLSGALSGAGSVQLGAGTLNAGAVSTSGALNVDVTGKAVLGQASGANVRLQAGDLTLSGALTGTGPVQLVAGTLTTGAVSTTGALAVDVTGKAVLGQTSGANVRLQAADLTLSGALTGTGPVQLVAGKLTTGAISTPGALIVDVTNKAVLGQTAAATARIVAGDLDLTGTLTATTAQIESRGGALRVGGAAGDGAGMTIDSNDFGQLRVSGQLSLYAGSTTGSARGDLTLQTLTTDTSRTPNIVFLVGSANNALVQGVVAPTATGGMLRIGDATNLNWRPGSILVTGGLGAATVTGGTTYSGVRAYDEIHLASRNDILMGSQRFITLIQGTAVADIDTAANKPSGVAPTADETNRVFVAAGRLEVSAENKVVQQNTAPAGAGAPVGVFFTGKFTPALIIDPPKVVELWGALAGPDGKVIGGAAAGGAITFTVVDATGKTIPAPADAKYKFNSCDVGTGNCSASISGGSVSAIGSGTTTGGGSGSAELGVSQTSAGVLAARDALSGPGRGGGSANSNDSESSEEAGAGEVSGGKVQAAPPVLAVTPPVNPDEIVTDPVTTGAGSEEIWRKRRQQK